MSILPRQPATGRSRAPHGPGTAPHWTSSAKQGIGTALTQESKVWFTLLNGALTEVYYPQSDSIVMRELWFFVADKSGFFSDERTDCTHQVSLLADGCLGYRLTNSCRQGRYTISKEILGDPQRDALLQRIKFETPAARQPKTSLYLAAAPALKNQGYGNNGWREESRSGTIFIADRSGVSLAIAVSAKLRLASCGYFGTSDGYVDVQRNGMITAEYDEAVDGHILFTAEIDTAKDKSFVCAVGFGPDPDTARTVALNALAVDFDAAKKEYLDQWRSYQRACKEPRNLSPEVSRVFQMSTAVLAAHSDKNHPGARIASLSIPWGEAHGDSERGGYHLVWTRDLVEGMFGALAAGRVEQVPQCLYYLSRVQCRDGHWAQNMWLDGCPHLNGVQMDETAFPILLAQQLAERKVRSGINAWEMVRAAAAFIVQNGPVTQQDRWEEDGGYSPFTLALEIAALLTAADIADDQGSHHLADYLRDTADIWNSQIERWTYVEGTDLAKQCGVAGYYVRITPSLRQWSDLEESSSIHQTRGGAGGQSMAAASVVSPDALALVRFGLRNADDPRILDTVKVIDATLKTETKTGPVWHRYNGDKYGEKEDGAAFDGDQRGLGRGWPLLALERGHYELARGDRKEARRMLSVVAAQSGFDLISEQVWDADDIPSQNLENGRPTRSAMPLVWAHAEFIKLAVSMSSGKIYDQPECVRARYKKPRPASNLWRFNEKTRAIRSGEQLRFDLLSPAKILYTIDNWHTDKDTFTKDSGLGTHYADIDTSELGAGATIEFTFYWTEQDRWEGRNFSVAVL